MYLKNKTGIALVLLFAVLLTGGCASSGSSNGEDASVADDAAVARDVRDAIQGRPALQDQGIVVSSAGGVVTLIGVVESAIERTLAVRVAEGVAGVVSVNNELTTP